MNNSYRSLFFLLFLVLFLAQEDVHAQHKTFDLIKAFQKNKINVVNRGAGLAKDNLSIVLSESEGEGLLWLEDINFSNGTIEVDLKGKDVFQKSFLGIAFHGINDSTFDAVYFRPFNFLSTDSVRRIHAVQYVSHPAFPWFKLREEHNGVYEKDVSPAPDPNEWFHVKIEVEGDQVAVFVNYSSKPSLTVKKLSEINEGKIGLWVGNGSGGEFRNLQFPQKKT